MLISQLPDQEYHSKPHLSSHQLKEFMRSPAHYQALLARKRTRASKAMEVGTCIHMALLEPERFQNAVLWEESCDRRSKAGKELYNEWLLSVRHDHIVISGRSTRPEIDNIVIGATDLDNIRGMQEAYYKQSWVAEIHSDGSDHENELSVFQEFEGVELRSRFDKVINRDILLDVKKTQDANPRTWKYDFLRYGYGYQMAFYRMMFRLEFGKMPSDVVIVAIEEQYPHAVVPYIIPSYKLDEYEGKIIENISTFKQCSDLNEWPSYCPGKMIVLDLE